MSTYSPKPGEITRNWHVIDANDVVLGRLAVTAATLLRGKHKPTYAPHVDGGDFVIIVNASKIALGGSKATDKFYYRHSGRPGSLKSVAAGDMLRTQMAILRRLAKHEPADTIALGRRIARHVIDAGRYSL